MMEQGLTFDTSATVIAITIFVIACSCVLSWIACWRSGFRRRIVMLEVLRVVLVASIVLLFNQPEIGLKVERNHEPTLVVLVDQSKSMSTRDVVSDGQAIVSRAERIEPLLDTKTWKRLSGNVNTVIMPFENSELNRETNLHHALAVADKQYANLRGIVLASDGDWNAGPPPVEMASRFGLRKIPVYVVPVGSTKRLPDLRMFSFDCPAAAVPDKPVRIPFSIESSLPRDHLAVVTLEDSDGEVLKKDVTVKAMGRTDDVAWWTPEEIGNTTLRLSVAFAEEEQIFDNNALSVSVSVRHETLRVLVIESSPRWEYRFLRNAFSRDPGITVSCLLFHEGLSKRGGGNADYIQAFPETLSELATYDVVFLGDVGLGDTHLTELQCEWLKGLVEQQASGLVIIPGSMGNTSSLANSPLQTLLPVELDQRESRGRGSQMPGSFALTRSGRRSLLTRLVDEEAENLDVWDSLPGFQWYAPPLRAKAGSDVLAVHRDQSNAYGRTPLIVTRSFGSGKVMWMGIDSVWRWRMGVEDRYHYRFWGQVVRWMAYQRNRAKGDSMWLSYLPEQPKRGQTVSFTANVMGSQLEPLADANVTLQILSPAGQIRTVTLECTDRDWGIYSTTHELNEPGSHTLTLRCAETNTTLESPLYVQDIVPEHVGRQARPDVLEEIAKVSQGRVFGPDDTESVIDTIEEIQQSQREIRRLRIWSHPATIVGLIFFFGLFWTGRKIVGLI
ncbi:hypothetical protein CA13_44110 [Planctomycetes bacterium CA13]|uniref:Glutamine amidotransferase domain-containing protein n=1 Tax=Novipirellula herctigrandis TaxID=2527986 RepID=A0A5C5Z6S1_9BACT|nr:hypothetical protein CA13_44110 [Planctomycetes bacterium CA13]